LLDILLFVLSFNYLIIRSHSFNFFIQFFHRHTQF
jgi:hypothetical protein